MSPGKFGLPSATLRVSATRERAQPLLLLAVSLVLVGIAGWAAALVMVESALSSGLYRLFGAVALAMSVAGLSVGSWVWRRWHLEGLAGRASALKLNWFHAVMSETNRLILKRPNPSELFEGVCEVCIAAGHLDIAIVDMLHTGEAHRAAANGRDPFATPTSAQTLLDGARLQMLMMTLALRAGSPIVSDDATTDPRLSEARNWCLATGLFSLAAIPLRRGGAPVGILLLHARPKAFFEGEVGPLLAELGADLSFAFDNADREKEGQAASLADRARVTAEDANKAKTEFLAQISHELRTPLNAMLGFAQLLAVDAVEPLSPGQAERVRLITHAGWHLLGLVNDVMDISRIESRHYEVVNVCGDISSVLDEAVALTWPLARKHRVELAERAASTFGIGAVVDPRRLHQVLLNLLSNACKYNRPGGRVRLDVTHAGAEVFIDVVDNGVGMTTEQLSHLFEPFNRLGNERRAIEGLGIGLALARQLVNLMQGRLEIDSNPATGTRVRVILPSCAIPRKVAASDTSVFREPAEPEHKALVLYIEDDPVNQILVSQMLLRCEGVQLLQAENGSDGMALAQLRQPDLVLLDMHLPDMTGLDVLSALRADPRTETLRVVAVSASAMPVDVAAAMELGALYYWTKPLKLESFLAGISTIVRTGVAAFSIPAGASTH